MNTKRSLKSILLAGALPFMLAIGIGVAVPVHSAMAIDADTPRWAQFVFPLHKEPPKYAKQVFPRVYLRPFTSVDQTRRQTQYQYGSWSDALEASVKQATFARFDKESSKYGTGMASHVYLLPFTSVDVVHRQTQYHYGRWSDETLKANTKTALAKAKPARAQAIAERRTLQGSEQVASR